mgnify:CR=1 FL=1
MLTMTIKERKNKQWITHPDPMTTSGRIEAEPAMPMSGRGNPLGVARSDWNGACEPLGVQD